MCRAPEAAENGLRLDALGNLISITVLTYRLWQMVCEWLHRIGDVLDGLHQGSSAAHILKAHVEFRDGDPPPEPAAKPTGEELERLCVVAPHDEPGAQRAIFEVGFLAGFRISENLAERLVDCLILIWK